MEQLEEKIDRLEQEIKEMKVLINDLIKVCGRMDTHITFVESIYDTLKNPIECIRRRFNYLSN